MSPKRFPPDDPREWLNRARSNLARAGDPVPGVYLEDLCFDAQQAAEKAIKAVIIARGERFRTSAPSRTCSGCCSGTA
jgi:HEPN domain-containing protein